MTPTYSLVYASARPHLIAGVVQLWESRCRHSEKVEWCIATDAPNFGAGFIDGFGQTATDIGEEITLTEYLERKIKVACLMKPPFSRIRAYNEAAKMSTGNWLVCVADDWVPCDGWDSKLSQFTCCGKHLRPATIMVHDEHKPGLMSLPIMSRAFYQQEGHFLYPEYVAWFADDHFTAVSKIRGRTIGTVFGFTHNHYDYGSRPKDSVDESVTQAVKDADSAVYERCKAQGFPLLKT